MSKYEDLLVKTFPYRLAALLILVLSLLVSIGGCATRVVSACGTDLSKINELRIPLPPGWERGKTASIGEHQDMCKVLVRDVIKDNELKRSFLKDATK